MNPEKRGGPGRGQGRKPGSKGSSPRIDAYGDQVCQIPMSPELGDAIRQYCQRSGISMQGFLRSAAADYLLNQ